MVCCCGSGCFGCILCGFEACSDGGLPLRKRRPGMHLDASSAGRCLGGVTSSFRASESDVRHFSWVVWRCFLRGFGACSDGGLPLRKRLHWMQMHLDPSSPDAVWSLPWRCNFFF